MPRYRIDVKNTLLFDLDGTLTDPFEGISRCFEYALERLNVAAEPGFDFRQLIGPPMQQSFEALVAPGLVDRAIGYYRERFRTRGLYENALYQGIEELVARLAPSYRLYVCTSKPTVYATQILRHFGLDGYFRAVYGSELDGRFAHKPELLAHLLSQERIAAQEASMIGDRKHDVIAALENGVTAYGAAWGYGTVEELRSAGAHAIFENPAALGAALR